MKEDRKITEICQHCGEEYVPTRKGIQKYCSDACRSRNWFMKQKKLKVSTGKELHDDMLATDKPIKYTPVETQKMSLGGIGDAAAGVLLADGIKYVAKAFENEEDKPATKADIKQLSDKINKRYFEVHNLSPDAMGRKPFFDMATSKIVYIDKFGQRFEFPVMDL